ncbi:carbohydrate ABC transporter permease [Atribacter laminatus]|uniref:sn-glycerol-3-phosphate transport system permease protein UgpA n=1 Tax=Atribacter laminatus TaxID=2847778 RepID=A0A7T1AN85_ATRLM|nr:sugar ABC transporter permease [Atribacter laminatus]QPM69006.1 sn-glycerol-3-phosphate transport system permease protein UgpA [Atribacter laminatus]
MKANDPLVIQKESKNRIFSEFFNKFFSNPYVGISPTVLMFALFLLFPVVFVFFTSFHNWDGIGPITKFVGIKHFIDLFIKDKLFKISFLNTIVLIAGAILIQVSLGMFLAHLIRGVKGQAIFRVIFLLPLAMPTVCAGIVWNMIYSPGVGLLNLLFREIPFLSIFGLDKVIWLGDPKTALFSLLLTYSWQYTGLYVVIIFAALQGVDPDLFEMADLEGANWLRKLVHITIPSIKKQLFICFMLCVVFTANLFPLVYIMTMGGPGNSTEILGLTIYKYGFRFFNMGSAAAMSVILMLFVILTTTGFTNLLRDK